MEDSTGTDAGASTPFEIIVLGTANADVDLSDTGAYADAASITTKIETDCPLADGSRRLLSDDEL